MAANLIHNFRIRIGSGDVSLEVPLHASRKTYSYINSGGRSLRVFPSCSFNHLGVTFHWSENTLVRTESKSGSLGSVQLKRQFCLKILEGAAIKYVHIRREERVIEKRTK